MEIPISCWRLLFSLSGLYFYKYFSIFSLSDHSTTVLLYLYLTSSIILTIFFLTFQGYLILI